jgi:hypothetical protein
MKRICFVAAIGLFVLWVSIFFVVRAGMASHTLILLSILFLLQAIILTEPKKIAKEAE